MPRDQLIVEAAAAPLPLDAPNLAQPLPVLPTEFLRGAPIDIQPKPKVPAPVSKSRPVLILNENEKNREPVSIPLPDLIEEEEVPTAPRSLKNLREFLKSSDSDFRE